MIIPFFLILFFNSFFLHAGWKDHLKKCEDKKENHHYSEIDFIYLINLKDRYQKWVCCEEQLTPHGIFPYRFEGINGWKLNNRTLDSLGMKFLRGMKRGIWVTSFSKGKEGAFEDDLLDDHCYEKNYFACGMTPGKVGCLLSHLSILQDAYDSQYQTIWVMEDDIEIIENPQQIPQLIRLLDQLSPDWDILYTDRNTKDFFGHPVLCQNVEIRPNISLRHPLAYYLQSVPIGDDFLEIRMRYGCYSMIIRRSGIEKILNYFTMYGLFFPIDTEFFLIPGLKQVVVKQDIVSTKAGISSDTQNRPDFMKEPKKKYTHSN